MFRVDKTKIEIYEMLIPGMIFKASFKDYNLFYLINIYIYNFSYFRVNTKLKGIGRERFE